MGPATCHNIKVFSLCCIEEQAGRGCKSASNKAKILQRQMALGRPQLVELAAEAFAVYQGRTLMAEQLEEVTVHLTNQGSIYREVKSNPDRRSSTINHARGWTGI
jgi:hypothetical protein